MNLKEYIIENLDEDFIKSENITLDDNFRQRDMLNFENGRTVTIESVYGNKKCSIKVRAHITNLNCFIESDFSESEAGKKKHRFLEFFEEIKFFFGDPYEKLSKSKKAIEEIKEKIKNIQRFRPGTVYKKGKYSTKMIPAGVKSKKGNFIKFDEAMKIFKDFV